MRSLLARRDVRILIAGQSLSMFGDWAMIIVLGIWAKVLTGSNAQAGLVFFVFALAGLLAPLGGLVVDRVHKRPLMIATHVAMAGVVKVTPGTAWRLTGRAAPSAFSAATAPSWAAT